MIELPKVGQVWQRDKLRREIVSVEKRSEYKNDYYVTWRRPGYEKTYTTWLKYWRQWRNKAALVF